MKTNVIDGKDRFEPVENQYLVTLPVKVNFSLLWMVIKCLYFRKNMSVTHSFPDNPKWGTVNLEAKGNKQ